VTRRTLGWLTLALAMMMSACASTPPPPPPPPEPTAEEKMSWILRLEDERVLRDPPPAPPPVTVPRSRNRVPVVIPPPTPDLVRLLGDAQPQIRRRAALAVGRVGLAEGAASLVALLADPEPEVREMAAFALGLIADRAARDPLIAALADPSLLVRGSAAEALGLLGDASAAEPIARAAREIVDSGALELPPDGQADVERGSPAGAFRLAVYALARLRVYPALASAVLDGSGQPRVRWWPVAYALQRLEDPAAQPALRALLSDPHTYTRALAARGLGATKDRSAVPALLPLATGSDRVIAVEAVRALARIADPSATPALTGLLRARETPTALRLEVIAAVASLGGEGVADTLIDYLGDPAPAIRAAALDGLARLDAEGFVFILSGIDPDPHWSVRVALARVLGALPSDVGLLRLKSMLHDTDQRVVAGVVTALANRRAPDAGSILIEKLKADDPIVRAAAARALAELTPPEAAAPLVDAYHRGLGDPTYVARAAAITALARYDDADVGRVLSEALADPDWAVRVRAASLLQTVDPGMETATRIRPAPTREGAEYRAPRVVNPPFSTELHLETDRGPIRIELAVLDAPQTIESLTALVRDGFYDGVTFHRVVPGFVIQAGDPRGDGEGGPGYTLRDELSERPYVRGTVGMALDWEDTGGSQFFIALSPQPHLDARYTVIGRVTSGIETVDEIEQWDLIRRARVWDGVAFAEAPR
jgi:HEAT repeat protein/cyclophilin family peptidyl-prolyl cis-trans isomerase